MPREPRVEVPGGIYHVGSRGNRGCVVYQDDVERRMFLRLLSLVTKRFSWICHSYVLMSNHFHLLIQLELGGLSDGLQLLNGGFAKFSNKRHGYVGQHLFRNRFWSDEIADEAHLRETALHRPEPGTRAHHCEPGRLAVEQLPGLRRPRLRAVVPRGDAPPPVVRGASLSGAGRVPGVRA